MAFCNKCGKQVPDGAAFCPGCGNPMTANTASSAGGAAPQQPPRVSPPPMGYNNSVTTGAYTPPQTLPMNWYKFVIWVQLFLSCAASVITGIAMLFGGHYSANGASPQLIYLYYPGLHVVDILFGLLYIAVGVFAIYARQHLAHFQKDGPTLYYLYLIAATVTALVYAILSGIIISNFSTVTSSISTILVNGVMLVLTYMYFEKRKDMFCN